MHFPPFVFFASYFTNCFLLLFVLEVTPERKSSKFSGYKRKNATELLQPVAASGLNRNDIIAVSDLRRQKGCSELMLSDCNSLSICPSAVSV